MLIVFVPRSAAMRIASTISSSGMPNWLKPSLTTFSLQPQPAPAMPRPLLVAAQARPEVWVPWPSGSVSGSVVPTASVLAILPANSGWEPSTPVSITATRAPAPVVKSQAR